VNRIQRSKFIVKNTVNKMLTEFLAVEVRKGLVVLILAFHHSLVLCLDHGFRPVIVYWRMNENQQSQMPRKG